MISCEHISKSFGGHILFDDAAFQIGSRERVGLVGRNGHGKTTLFRLITGQESVDDGAVIMPKNYRLGYVRQHLRFHQPTVLKEGMTGLIATEKDHSWKVEKILAGLGFSNADMQRPPNTFSGGFQVRLNLAKVLVSEPDLLLLDEPTNYLDIASIRWIIRFLNNWPRELMLITHDRGFMDQVVTHVIGIHRCKIRKISGATEKYYTQLAQEEEIYEKTRLNDDRRRKEIEQFIGRFRAKARLANLVQSRIKTLAKMEKKDKLTPIESLDFRFRALPMPGRQAMQVETLGFGYSGAARLIDRFSLTVNSEDRICIVGPNGRGKTTLLKLLAGRLAAESGSIACNPNTAIGYYEQTNVDSLEPTRTVEDEILYAHGDVERQAARNICGSMMFRGNDALKRVAVLSGGEKSRVMLGKLLVTPVNVLMLDEPTNHLDMEACDALLAAIDYFEGAVIMVTHNEMFLHALARRLVIFQGGEIEVFDGGYQDFLDRGGWIEEEDKPPVNRDDKPNRKALKRLRSEFIARRARALKPLKKQIATVEDAIERREVELAQLNKDLVAASGRQDATAIATLSRRLHQCQADIEDLFDQLERDTAALEQSEKEFDAAEKQAS